MSAVYTCKGGCESNEDNVFCGGGAFAVADGLGGHSGGAAASEAAVKYFSEHYRLAADPAGMAELLEGANTAVRRLGRGMSTVAAAGLGEGGFTLGNVGDSRVYFFHSGRIIAQTRDHSVCQAAVEMGEITPEQIRGNEDRSRLLKALGSAERLDLKKLPEQLPVHSGDAFLLCTDGFWEHVHEREMECDLAKSENPTEWRDRMLKRLLLKTGNGGDNYTVLCGILTDQPEEPSPKRKAGRAFRLPRLLITAAAVLLMLAGLIAALMFLSSDGGEASESGSSVTDIL